MALVKRPLMPVAFCPRKVPKAPMNSEKLFLGDSSPNNVFKFELIF